MNNAPRRSGLKVEFSELGFRVRARGNISAEEQDEALDSLYERVDSQEKTALRQLQGIFRALTEYVWNFSIWPCYMLYSKVAIFFSTSKAERGEVQSYQLCPSLPNLSKPNLT